MDGEFSALFQRPLFWTDSMFVEVATAERSYIEMIQFDTDQWFTSYMNKNGIQRRPALQYDNNINRSLLFIAHCSMLLCFIDERSKNFFVLTIVLHENQRVLGNNEASNKIVKTLDNALKWIPINQVFPCDFRIGILDSKQGQRCIRTVTKHRLFRVETCATIRWEYEYSHDKHNEKWIRIQFWGDVFGALSIFDAKSEIDSIDKSLVLE